MDKHAPMNFVSFFCGHILSRMAYVKKPCAESENYYFFLFFFLDKKEKRIEENNNFGGEGRWERRF